MTDWQEDEPIIDNFDIGVVAESEHQVRRWGSKHDDAKSPEDWYWTLGYLSGKALHAVKSGDLNKARHHLISSAALLRNQHRRLSDALKKGGA